MDYSFGFLWLAGTKLAVALVRLLGVGSFQVCCPHAIDLLHFVQPDFNEEKSKTKTIC